MELNSKKCKEMMVWFLKYDLSRANSIYISLPVERVSSHKRLGVIISLDLIWNVHVNHIRKKANFRLYALRQRKKAGLNPQDLVHVYCLFLRPCLEYASPVLSDLSDNLSKLIESVQKRALRIYPLLSYENAFLVTGFDSQVSRRHQACLKFVFQKRTENQIGNNPLADILRKIENVCDHSYKLRHDRSYIIITKTE